MADEKPNNIFVRRLKDEEQQPKHVSTETEWYCRDQDVTKPCVLLHVWS